MRLLLVLAFRIQNDSNSRRCGACTIADRKLALSVTDVVYLLAQLRGKTVEFVAAEATVVVLAGSSPLWATHLCLPSTKWERSHSFGVQQQLVHSLACFLYIAGS